MELLPALQPTTPPSSASPVASSASDARPAADGRPVNGGYNFNVRAAGIGKQQIEKQRGFEGVGPSSQGWATTVKQRDGSWLTTIGVPYGVHLGGEAKPNSETDRYTTMKFESKQQPTKNSEGRLFISGREITGDLLTKQLEKLGLDLPDYRNFTYGGTAPE